MANYKRFTSGIIGIYAFAVMSLAFAQNMPTSVAAPAPEHSGQHMSAIFSQLNLTDEQKKQLEDNKKQHRTKMEAARKQLKLEKQAIQHELMKPQLDLGKINEIHAQIKSLQNQMEDIKLNSILEVRSILTSDQFTQFVNLMHKQDHD